MNTWFLIAALLIYLIALAHSILGEWLLIGPLFRLELPKLAGSEGAMRRVIRFAWHLTTIILWGIASVVAYWTLIEQTEAIVVMAHIVAITFIFSGIFSAVMTRARHFSWYVFLAIGLLIWIGSS